MYSHANWAQGMGGISFPLLADFHPKGAVAKSFGLYLEDKGITDRATVIIDAGGVVRYAVSVTPGGERDLAELAAECRKIDAAYPGELPPAAPAPGLEGGSLLYVRSNCGFSQAVLLARDNLHLGDRLPVKNVSEDAAARADLERRTGKEQAPCLLVGEKPILESKGIIDHLVSRTAPL